MEITVQTHYSRIDVIQVSGRLEALTVSNLRSTQDKLLEDGANKFILDISRIEFMDSAGMAALVSLLKRARQSGGDVILVKPIEPGAYRILTLTRFDQVFTMAASVEEAMQAF